VRTASRLDFVAKCLALGGLGALGLSAALLDRSTAVLPLVPPPAMDVTAPAVQTAMMLSQSAAALQAPPRTKQRRFLETRSQAPEQPAVAEILSTPGADFAGSTPDQHQLPVAIDVAPVPGSLVALSVLPPIAETWPPIAASAVVPTERSDEGFVSGILKRTGSSVGNSLGKASTTLLGAARVVGGVVKRAF
jgi:hypothetical protein